MNKTEKNSLFKYKWRTKRQSGDETKLIKLLLFYYYYITSSNIAGTFVFTNINKSIVDIFPKIDIFLYHFRDHHRLEFQKFTEVQASTSKTFPTCVEELTMVHDSNPINLKKKLIRRCRIGAHDGDMFVSMWTSEPFPA